MRRASLWVMVLLAGMLMAFSCSTTGGDGMVPLRFSTGGGCTDLCSPSGEEQCSGYGYQICGNYDSDSCLEWSSVVACGAGERCQNGYCSCTDLCTPSGNLQCSGNGFQTCGNYDSDQCLEWSEVTACNAFEICSNGSCISCDWTKLGSDLRVTNDVNFSGYPSLVWSGSEFGVSWMDGPQYDPPEIYFARVSSVGTKLGSDLRVTDNGSFSSFPSLSWTGSEFGVSWFDSRDGNDEIYFARVSSAGAKIGSNLRVTNDPNDSILPSLSWTGSEFGVSWMDNRDGNDEIYFARVSSAGAKIGSDLRVTNDANASWLPSLSWAGSEFGVSWYDDRDGNNEIYFARVSSAGVKLGSDLRVTNDASSSLSPSLTWTGSEFGVSWYDWRDGNDEIYFARVSSAGAKLGSDLRVTNDASYSLSPSLTWTGSEFGVSWWDDRDGNDEIYFARVSSAGAKLGSDLRVTNDANASWLPSLSWTGSEFGVSWTDGDYEIYFARIGAVCP